jgi:hypothetical protein
MVTEPLEIVILKNAKKDIENCDFMGYQGIESDGTRQLLVIWACS